jgi:hypothetical protein
MFYRVGPRASQQPKSPVKATSLPGLKAGQKFNFNEWMAEKERMARSSLEFHNRFGLAQDFELNPPLLDHFGGWNPML